MYSRNMRRQDDATVLPPRYSGVRFKRGERADGRAFAVEEPLPPPVPVPADEVKKQSDKNDALSRLLSGIGRDDLLIAALIIILSGEGEPSREAVLLLLLLLCIR